MFSHSTATPNHALQRTAPHVTAPASTATFPPTVQVPRRAPRSLSLRSLGHKTLAMRIRGILIHIVAWFLLFGGVANAGDADGFTMSPKEVITQQSKLRGEIVEAVGDTSGPFKPGGQMVGNIGVAGSFRAGVGFGSVEVSWPATKGVFFEAAAYLDAAGRAFVVVRRVPVAAIRSETQ